MKNLLEKLRKEANKKGAMGSENVSVTINTSEINIDELPVWMTFEHDRSNLIISCEAENLY